MAAQKNLGWGTGALVLMGAGLVAVLPAVGEDVAADKPVRIGMVRTLFRDTPESLVMVLMQPFGAMMEAQTGLKGKLITGGDAQSVGQQLAEDKLQLAVFHGVEFAWARLQHPELRPLIVAVNQQVHLQAYVVARVDGAAPDFANLKGKTLARPRGTREHCHMFLERQCREFGSDPGHFFARITTPPNSEEALDDLVDGEVEAAVVDNVALECFQRRKPGRFSRLKVVAESEVFPAGVVAYRPGALDAETLRRFRDGMINAPNTPMGRQLMTMWKLTSFEPVPADYDQTLDEIVKAYPAPIPASK